MAGPDQEGAVPVGKGRHPCQWWEVLNHQLGAWCAQRAVFFTRSRPHTSNDNAHVEQKNGDIVRKSTYRYRYDTPAELDLLGQLWELVNLRKNYLLPTKKATGWCETTSGRRVHTYDAPRTPYQRLLNSGILTAEQADKLGAIRSQLIDHARAKNLVLRRLPPDTPHTQVPSAEAHEHLDVRHRGTEPRLSARLRWR